MMNAVEGIYYDDLFTFFPIVDITEFDTCTSTNSSKLLEQLVNHWKNDPVERDLIHLFSGKNFVDPAIGRAIQPGLHDLSEAAYGVTQHVSEGGPTYYATLYGKTIIVAHEIGHNFNGTQVEAAFEERLGVGTFYTVMWPGYMGDEWMIAHFSNGQIGENPYKNNLAWMIPYAHDHLPD
ncbi:MAG: M12 family metallo-peptidase [Candidatus Heimdallarchaeota archaeon]